MARLKEMYNNEIVDAMTKKFGYQNIMQVPKLEKIVVNMGVGEAKENSKILDSAIADLEKITGQKAVTTKAKNTCTTISRSSAPPLRTISWASCTACRWGATAATPTTPTPTRIPTRT